MDFQHDLDNLAEAIYFESRSEPVACQIILAQTILNRVKQDRFGDTIKEVIHQRKRINGKWVCQYSYYCDNKPEVKADFSAELVAYQVSSMVLLDEVPDLSEGADHYYAYKKVDPNWSKYMKNTFVCGDHIFGTLTW